MILDILFQLFPWIQELSSDSNSNQVWFQTLCLWIPKGFSLSWIVQSLLERNEGERSFETDLEQVWEWSPSLSWWKWKTIRFWKLFHCLFGITIWISFGIYSPSSGAFSKMGKIFYPTFGYLWQEKLNKRRIGKLWRTEANRSYHGT